MMKLSGVVSAKLSTTPGSGTVSRTAPWKAIGHPAMRALAGISIEALALPAPSRFPTWLVKRGFGPGMLRLKSTSLSRALP